MPWTVSQPLDQTAFARLAEALSRNFRADLFLSGPGFTGETQSIAGIEPVLECLVTGETTRQELSDFVLGPKGPTLGYLAYPFGLIQRGLTTAKPSPHPLGHFKKYAATARYDHLKSELAISSEDPALGRAVCELARTPGPESAVFSGLGRPGALRASLTGPQYRQAVEAALESIKCGDIYQINLSIKFACAWPKLDAPALFFDLFKAHPAPFYVWFASGARQLMSASPERFLRVRGGRVLSQPIKGTAPVGEDRQAAIRRLLDDPKEDAELSMIVDLIRNDVSLNCAYGSVAVEGHKSLLEVDGLLQMFANVTGVLKQGRTSLDLALDAFPGGSVTGCPKRRALEIIDRLEPHDRDYYCGSFMIFDEGGELDSSVAIRTAAYDMKTGEFGFYAGSGIVVDSDPEREYRETIHKAAKFLKLTGHPGT